MSEQNPAPVQERIILPDQNKKGKGFFSRLWGIITNNWVMKLVCLVLAVLLWGFIYSQDDTLTRDKVFTGVPVKLADTYVTSLKNKGIIIADWNDGMTVTVRVRVPQKYYDELTADAITVRPDTGSIRKNGSSSREQVSVKLVCEVNSKYGTAKADTDEITLTIEEYRTRNSITVNVMETGDMPAGYRVVSRSPEGRVSLDGPYSLVYGVRRIEACIDLSSLEAREGTQSVIGGIRLFDKDGNEIDPSGITVTLPNSTRAIDFVNVTVVLERIPEKETPAEGFLDEKVRVEAPAAEIPAAEEPAPGDPAPEENVSGDDASGEPAQEVAVPAETEAQE
ncbi:MAG: hypothetical protein CW338_01875 [Clostridiales bacterium]|nr:hypothetical protein [Clostridiales bacterium]